MNLQPLLESLSTEATPLSLDALEAADWEQLARAIRHGAFHQQALVRLATAAGGNEDAVPVLRELTVDLGVSLAIARALLTEDSVDQLRTLLDEAGFAASWEAEGPPERLVVPLATLFGMPRAWLWLARGLVHTSVVALLPDLSRDGDVAIREAAVMALAATPGDAAIDTLFSRLHDPSERVREAARRGLEARCTDEALRGRLERELNEVTQLASRASSFQLSNLLEGVPGLTSMVSVLRQGPPKTRRATVLSGLRKRFRLYRGREDSLAYVALAVTMAWADGQILEDEAATLDSLADEYLTASERETILGLIQQRPNVHQLAGLIAKLHDPRQVASALRKDFDVDGEEARRWLRTVARAALLPEDALLPQDADSTQS